MLAPMGFPKPLAGWSIVIAFALIGAALLANAWSTRSTVANASQVVASGEAVELQSAVREDLTERGGPRTGDDLADIVKEHADKGLRYLATLDSRGRVAAQAGKPIAEIVVGDQPGRPERHIEYIGGRMRVELRGRGWGRRARGWWVVMELEPLKAHELRDDASRTFWIGGVAALTLLGVAIGVVRRELRRQADEQRRERERRLQSLGEMSAVLAHEIKNPLASLKGNAQLLA